MSGKVKPPPIPHIHNWVAWGYEADSIGRPMAGTIYAYCKPVDKRYCIACGHIPCHCARVFREDEWKGTGHAKTNSG